MSENTPYIEHKCTPGDRWDTIAAKYYGNPFKYAPLIMFNPDVQRTFILQEGTVIKVPKIENNNENTENLPPWKA